jgi:hypothetical protein
MYNAAAFRIFSIEEGNVRCQNMHKNGHDSKDTVSSVWQYAYSKSQYKCAIPNSVLFQILLIRYINIKLQKLY